MKTRTAACCCGELSITVSGEPEKVLLCHCDYCQRRTGSVAQVSCWYYGDQVVERRGEGKVYQGPDNMGIEYTFCPQCGSTVYWAFGVMRPVLDDELYGIAVGNFAEPDFPEPTIELWASKRHGWLHGPAGLTPHPEFPPQELMMPARVKRSS